MKTKIKEKTELERKLEQMDVSSDMYVFSKNYRQSIKQEKLQSEQDSWMDELFDDNFAVPKPTNISNSVLVQWDILNTKLKQIKQLIEEKNLELYKKTSNTSFPYPTFPCSFDYLSNYNTKLNMLDESAKGQDIKVKFDLKLDHKFITDINYTFKHLSVYSFVLSLKYILTKTYYYIKDNKEVVLNQYTFNFKIQDIDLKALYSSTHNELFSKNAYFKTSAILNVLKSYTALVYKNKDKVGIDDKLLNLLAQKINNDIVLKDKNDVINIYDVQTKLDNLITYFKEDNLFYEDITNFLKFVFIFGNEPSEDVRFDDTIIADSNNDLVIFNHRIPTNKTKAENIAYVNFETDTIDAFDKISNSTHRIYGMDERMTANVYNIDKDSVIRLYYSSKKNEFGVFGCASYKVSDLFKTLKHINLINTTNTTNTKDIKDTTLQLLYDSKKIEYGNVFKPMNYFINDKNAITNKKINITHFINALKTNSTSNKLTDYKIEIEKEVGFKFSYDFDKKQFSFNKKILLAFPANKNLDFNDIKKINDFVKQKLNFDSLIIWHDKYDDKGYDIIYDASISLNSNIAFKNENDFDFYATSLKVVQLHEYNASHDEKITDLNDPRLDEIVIKDANLQSALLKEWVIKASIDYNKEKVSNLLKHFYIESYCKVLDAMLKEKVLKDLLESINSIELLNKINAFDIKGYNEKIKDIYNTQIIKSTEIDLKALEDKFFGPSKKLN